MTSTRRTDALWYTRKTSIKTSVSSKASQKKKLDKNFERKYEDIPHSLLAKSTSLKSKQVGHTGEP